MTNKISKKKIIIQITADPRRWFFHLMACQYVKSAIQKYGMANFNFIMFVRNWMTVKKSAWPKLMTKDVFWKAWEH